MSGAPTQISLMLASLLAATPLILTLLVSVVICWRQRERRPKTSQLLGWATFAYLLWASIGARVYRLFIHFAGLEFGPDQHDEIVWALKTIAITVVPATVHAVVWGCALWSILMIDEHQDVPQPGR